MSLETAIDLVGSLLIPGSYTDLQRAENVLRERGIEIEDDFIFTDQRMQVLDNIETQFTNMVAPTVILTGWFGSGKTAFLSRMVKRLRDGRLLYGGRSLDPIEIQLNEQYTLSLFLEQILGSIAELKTAEWVLKQYERAKAFVDLPDVTPGSIRGLVEVLVQMPPIRMGAVAQFLGETFESYKRSVNGERVLVLVIDEMEYLTRRTKLEGTDKLEELLRILINTAVREAKEELAATRDPKVVVIFSIMSRHELAATNWFHQDTLERMRSVELNLDLSADTAKFLMKEMLRIYFTSVVEGLLEESADGRLAKWANQLVSAQDADHPSYTFPVMPEIHQFFVSRLLKLSPEGQVLSFRAYQAGIHTLLSSWKGKGPVDLRFMIDHYEDLFGELEQYPGGVILDNLIGEEQVRSLVERKFSQLRGGVRFQLGTVTHLTIIRGTTPVVPITRKDLKRWLPEEKVPTEAAFRELLESVKRIDLDDWSVTGDAIYVNAQSVVAQLSEHVEPISVEEQAEELVRETQSERTSRSAPEIFRDWLDVETYIEASCDELGILHVTDNSPRGQLIGTFFLAFDIDEAVVRSLVDKRTALCLGIVFRETERELPFEVSVLLPKPLRDRGEYYADKIRDRFQQSWDDSFSPLIRTIVRVEKRSYYDAFKETLKVMLLLKDRSHTEREAFKVFEKDLKAMILDVDLTPSDREKWISAKLRFASFHDIDPTRRLIKVLSWQQGEEESALYDSSDDVQPSLHSRFNVPLPTPEEWRREVAEEWEDEDFISGGRLVPSSEWPEPLRRLYRKVNNQLRQQTLPFYDVGKIVFGETRIDNLLKAKVALHLFLKLGKVSPWNWDLTDDRHRYKDMQVSSGERRKKQLVQQIRQNLQSTLHDLVLAFYLASSAKRDQWLERIKEVLRVRAQLSKDKPKPTLQAWEQKFAELAPGRPTKHYIEEELIQRCPPHVSKQAEYLAKLRRLLQGESSLAYAVSQKVPDFVEQISTDVECEGLYKRIERLYKNWGEEVPFNWNKERFLFKLYKEYTSGLSEIPNWEKRKATDCDSKFGEKVSNLSEEGLEDMLQSICNWLDMRAKEIINPEWKATYDEDEIARLEQLLKDSLEKAAQEISELRNDLNSQIEAFDRFESDPLLTPYSQQIREYRLRLRQDDTSLSQIQGQLEEIQFGPMLADIRGRLNQWKQFRAKMLQRRNSIVDPWLE
ncbi:MAG: hypothetical protein ACE5IO_03835, partial [Thermoplasmata archaeon]